MAPIDPRRSHFTYISGIKGSGKSEYAWYAFDSYPFDRLVLDVTHDVTKMLTTRGVEHQQISTPIPGSWPEHMRDPEVDNGRLTLVFRPDMGSAEAFDELDRCVGLCLRGGPPTLLWCDEIGEVCTGNRTGPGMRRALHHGRHDNLSMLMCGPRAKDVNPLCIGQADKTVTFRMLNRYDREALARNMGVDQDEFDELNKNLAKYEHMVWTREDEEIAIYEPLPKWRRGRRPPVEVHTG